MEPESNRIFRYSNIKLNIKLIIPRRINKANNNQNFFFKNNQDLSSDSLVVLDTGKNKTAKPITKEITKDIIAKIIRRIIEMIPGLSNIKYANKYINKKITLVNKL